jgi:peptide/nickel transport system substrate-binding protein
VAELQTGQVDIITNVPPIMVGQLKAHPGVEVKSIPSGRVIFLYINTFAPGPLQDKRVRQALNYAVDKQSIIDKVLLGSGYQVASTLIASDFGYDPSLKPYPYDPKKAKQILVDAGYKDLKLVLNSPAGRYVMDKQVSEAVAGMLQQVGIKVDFRVREWGDYVSTLLNRKLEDLGLIGFGQVMYDADGRFTWGYIKESKLCYYSDPEVEGWILEARHTMDLERREKIYHTIQKKLYEEAPVVWLFQQQDNWGVSKKVKGFQPTSYEIFYLHKVSKEK